MCPDSELISAFVDDEVPSPWNNRLADHLATCPDCARKAGAYRELGGALRERSSRAALAETAAEDASVDRVRELFFTEIGQASALPVWNRRIAVPMPLIAAAALAIVFLSGYLASGILQPGPTRINAVAAADISPRSAQGASMDDLIRYLEANDAHVNVTIRLPETTTFEASGTPILMRASSGMVVNPASKAPLGSDDPASTTSSDTQKAGQ